LVQAYNWNAIGDGIIRAIEGGEVEDEIGAVQLVPVIAYVTVQESCFIEGAVLAIWDNIRAC
jgi:hypothetical protein